MGKKKLDVMAKEREVFINGQTDEDGNIIVPGCVRNGIDKESANKIFDEMAEFAKYAFNKSHAACYAVVAYRTAYLKAYYPAEFMAATLNSFLGNLDKIPQYIEECKNLGIEILKPDINKSNTKFTVENVDDVQEQTNGNVNMQKLGKIRFGLGSIKNVGIIPINTIVKERNENGEYKNFVDFYTRIANEGVNKKCIESLIKAGVFSEFSQNRATLLASFENIIDSIQSQNKKGFEGQVTMFDLGNENNDIKEKQYTFTELKEFTEKELLSMEKEMLGIYLTGHPLEKLKEQIEMQTNINTIQIKEIDEQMQSEDISVTNIQFKDGQEIKLVGIITSIKKKYTKNNKLMAFVTVEDLYGSVEIIVFENAYLQATNSLVEENIIMIDGRLSIRDNEATSIIAKEITNFAKSKSKILTLNITGVKEEIKQRLRGAILFFNGDRNNIVVQVKDNDENKPCGKIYLTDEILSVFQEILGKEKVTIDET